MTRSKRYYAVQVTWHDAFTVDKWRPTEEHVDVGKSPCVCVSVGWLLYQDKDIVVIGQSLSAGGTRVGESLTVPRGMVKQLRYLHGGK